MQAVKKDSLEMLRKEILDLQGLGIRPDSEQVNVPLGEILENMPGGVFPTGAIHEFLSPTLTSAAAATGFIAAIIHSLMQSGKPCVWISTRRMIFPPAIRVFGIEPDRFIFIDTPREKEAFWAIEEALRCESLCAVIGEIATLDFKESRRLQLAVESSRVTGFINRRFPHRITSTACVARWQVQPVNSKATIGLPGLAFPRWKVELLKIRSGRPASWLLEWSGNAFHTVVNENPQQSMLPNLKTGVA
ncbi:protein ImuA [Arachidicoccus rhizosphaerae]|jgi:protein ImuA|uniref:Protein ImuA n=1 Tax=Arachidicoccus rhizosphaerae TaxID=551991 RepID=A0A1H3ZHM0_9BACT|nr:hypothetical protein [Arachidicoccus rhizosphaerae]SEA23239.1 protein ImuA [Arachidicoccus rhizosphaerae]